LKGDTRATQFGISAPKFEFWEHMTNKTKTGILVVQIIVLWVVMFFLSQSAGFVQFYSQHLFPPIQSFRLMVFGLLPLSAGDVLYLLGGLWLVLTLIRWVYFIRKLGAYKERLAGSLLNTINVALFVYFLFLLGWGGNYSKSPLAKSWGLSREKITNPESAKARDKAAVIAFNTFLLEKINTYAPRYIVLPYSHINERAIAYYREYTDSRVKQNGLGVKPTMFGYFMQRMGVDGYYNPFTGEGQINKELPVYMMPFTVCHEMAHQAGIAAEGDANLMAYAIGTAVNDPVFLYSAYLNLWLYANNRLYRYDSAGAKRLSDKLNPLTKAHIDTLEEISRKYHGVFSTYTSGIYDSYLRLQNQEEGIKSYSNVTKEAWLLEMKRKGGRRKIITIP
jgi:hypothetical protein